MDDKIRSHTPIITDEGWREGGSMITWEGWIWYHRVEYDIVGGGLWYRVGWSMTSYHPLPRTAVISAVQHIILYSSCGYNGHSGPTHVHDVYMCAVCIRACLKDWVASKSNGEKHKENKWKESCGGEIPTQPMHNSLNHLSTLAREWQRTHVHISLVFFTGHNARTSHWLSDGIPVPACVRLCKLA